ncbi:MAG: DUF2336 domain-containing protein [Pseudomonadota bacterium]
MTVQSMRPQLTEADIVRLMKGETSEERAGVAHRLCRRIAIDALSDDEREYADEIIQILAQDAAELVRRTLSVTLRNSPKLPREVALKLAEDVESVALPVLENSPVFSDEDLRELVLSVTAAKQSAIASRSKISSSLSETISEHAAEIAVETLAGNPGADLSDKAYETQLSRFPKNATLHERIVLRDHVPVHIAEKMVSLVSGSVFDMLINRHELPAQMAIDLAAGSRERATIDLVEQAGRANDLPRFVSQLHLNGRLTQSLIMRALCVGHMPFVEHALAELSGVPHGRVWLMIHDAGPLGLQAVFDRAGLHRKLLPAFRAGVKVYHELEMDGEANDKARFRMRMIERVLTQFQAIPKEDLDYLLEKLDAYSEEAKRREDAVA